MNGLSFLALFILAIGIVIAYRVGIRHGLHDARATVVRRPITPDGDSPSHAVQQQRVHSESIDVEKTRLIVSYEAECERLRRDIADQAADSWQAREFADDRRRLLRAIADARGETARYRQLLIDLENNAPPLLLDSPGAPDDLKLIVGVGPVLERMLQQLGINSYRQIARWTERDIDEFNARLSDFPGRIRRDGWVAQARALHQSKDGESVPSRERS